ncbi:hypothetical protein niasHS_000880 [Heterodera schachtii]|uniref:Homeobox domain-containing protein n=1 Tax=Heterodera schachtii TaxID=97005 RepID=A0ABD2KM08_HETSC
MFLQIFFNSVLICLLLFRYPKRTYSRILLQTAVVNLLLLYLANALVQTTTIIHHNKLEQQQQQRNHPQIMLFNSSVLWAAESGSDGIVKIFTECQLYTMEKAFITCQHPDVQMREHLADKLKLCEERVEVWFKKSASERKEENSRC